jgi:hypothetical protein
MTSVLRLGLRETRRLGGAAAACLFSVRRRYDGNEVASGGQFYDGI